MPLYDYKCSCGEEFTHFFVLADYKKTPECPKACQGTVTKLIKPTMVAVDYPAYISPSSGKLIEGRKARMEDMKRTGCREYEIGEKEDFLKNKAADEKKFEGFIDEAVEKTYHQLNA